MAPRTHRARGAGHAEGMALILIAAGASYALVSFLSEKVGPRRPD
ncbi:MAG: hypothetical protein ABI950_12360 [Solirubrobacteraceae bacterium]